MLQEGVATGFAQDFLLHLAHGVAREGGHTST
jgi:hypothetical protein